MNNKVKILISGWCGLDPIGRHGLSFISALIKDDRNLIFFDSDFLRKDTKKIFADFFQEDYTKIKYSNSQTDKQGYDFLVVTTFVLGVSKSEEWCFKSHKIKAKKKICYVVFDGTVPPLEWIDEINNNYDMCLSPSNYCAHNLKRNGVNIECFGLECVIFMNELLNRPIKTSFNDRYRIGCVSGFEARKNLQFLVKAFSKTFTKNDNVELYIHARERNSLMLKYIELENLVKDASKTCNIILNKNFVSHQEMLKIWDSFDAYVIPQTNTGYYTTPVEALACGLPVILSDIAVHRELTNFVEEKNNLFFVPHNIKIPEYHYAYDFRNIGVGFTAKEDDYAKIFKTVFAQREFLRNVNLQEKRKEMVKCFTPNRLKETYEKIFHSAIIPKKEEIFYEEELDSDFKAIEKCAISSQQIYLAQKNQLSYATRKYLTKIQSLAMKKDVSITLPLFYRLMKICSVIKKRKCK